MLNFYFKPQIKNREVETQPLVKLWIAKKIQSNFIDEMKPSYTDTRKIHQKMSDQR